MRGLRILAMVGILVTVPASAQEPLGPGEGKPIIFSSLGTDIATTNPLLANDAESADVISNLFPILIGLDPETGLPTRGSAGSLAIDWTVTDNHVITITLRDDWTWSDGTLITSDDVKYAYDAVASAQFDSPYTSFLSTIEAVEAPAPQTVVVTLGTSECDALLTAASIPVVPAHHYREQFPTFADITTDHPSNFDPQVTAGPFKFGVFRPGEGVTLLADQNYPDSPAGYVVPEGVIFKSLADERVAYEQFLDGEITIVFGTPEDRWLDSNLRAARGDFLLIDRPTSGWQILLFNTADPEKPQSGADASGEPVPQPPHPILGNVGVRKAIAHAINFNALNLGAFSGLGTALGGPMVPQSWAYNPDILPYEFDLELSQDLLVKAGWIDDDGDIETPRVADVTVGTVAPGRPLALDLMIFTGNTTEYSAAVLIQDQLKQIGIDVRLDVLDFNVMVGELVGQSYDMGMIYWGVPASSPQAMYDQLGLTGDVPGAGFNTGSFYNAEFEEVMQAAKTLPGCDQAERKALYDRAQEIIHDEVPYYLVNWEYARILVQNNVGNFAPKKNSVLWNLPAWSIR
ncbi:MAG: hypothetical protein IPK52_14195 [Chloroflexi bacterium]|nr:hypothetical protein [Chloroflexota bacterium]